MGCTAQSWQEKNRLSDNIKWNTGHVDSKLGKSRKWERPAADEEPIVGVRITGYSPAAVVRRPEINRNQHICNLTTGFGRGNAIFMLRMKGCSWFTASAALRRVDACASTSILLKLREEGKNGAGPKQNQK